MKKRILITGSTDGIGKLTALKLAAQGHTVYLHGRNKEKLDAALAEVKSASNNEDVYGFVADLSDLKTVKAMATAVKVQVNKLDVLINNAGVFKSPVSQSVAGYDICFTVNYLAPYLLTKELLPLFEKADDARIINLSSAAQSQISYNAMLGKQAVAVNEAYAQSKLALTMWSFYLGTQLKDVTVIAVNPGSLLNTKMAKEAFGQYWAPAEKGANILLDLTLAETHNEHSGEYYDNDAGGYAQAHPAVYDHFAVSKLIDFTNNLID